MTDIDSPSSLLRVLHPSRLAHLVLRPLIRPRPAQSEPERRRSRFLTWLLASLEALVAAALVFAMLFEDGREAGRHVYLPLTATLMLLLGLAWWLNRSGRYPHAVHLTITCATIGPWAAILLDPAVLHGDFSPPLYLGLSVMLAAILLPERAMLVLAALQSVGYAAILLLTAPRMGANWPSLLLFSLALMLISVVTNVLGRADMRQIEEQNALLTEREAQLRELSVRDPVTGLFNRRYLEETLEREVRRAGRNQTSLGLIMIDIDHFKRINDLYGHAAGDAALSAVGAYFKAAVRASDVVCRYGGEEFVFMLPDAGLDATYRRAEQLREGMQRLHVEWRGRTLDDLTLSMGVAVFPKHGTDGEELLDAADTAMYQAKAAGRDRVSVAGGLAYIR